MKKNLTLLICLLFFAKTYGQTNIIVPNGDFSASGFVTGSNPYALPGPFTLTLTSTPAINSQATGATGGEMVVAVTTSTGAQADIALLTDKIDISNFAANETFTFSWQMKTSVGSTASPYGMNVIFYDEDGVNITATIITTDIKTFPISSGTANFKTANTYYSSSVSRQIANSSGPKNAKFIALNIQLGKLIPSGSTGNITLDNITLSAAGSVLPVSLASFNAKAVNEGVLLNWKTVSEKNNNYFEILRAGYDGKFNALSKVTGVGNSDKETTYSFVDKNPLFGQNYYQLKQIDFDGTTTLFPDIKGVKADLTSSNYIVSLLNNNLNILYNALSESSASIKIYASNGSLVYNERIQMNKGLNSITKSLDLLPGIYVAVFNSEGITKSTKLVN